MSRRARRAQRRVSFGRGWDDVGRKLMFEIIRSTSREEGVLTTDTCRGREKMSSWRNFPGPGKFRQLDIFREPV